MHFFPEEGYQRILVLFLYLLLGTLSLMLFFRYLFPALLPFLLAFLVASLLARPARALSLHTRLPRRLAASLLAVLSASALLGGTGLLIWKLLSELGDFLRAVVAGENPLLDNLQGLFVYIEDLAARLPFSGGENGEALRDMITDALLELAKNIITELGTRLPVWAANFAGALPSALVFGVVTILSSVYFCADHDRILAFFREILPKKVQEKCENIRLAAGKTLGGVLRSYALLFLFTFAELLLGFVLLREPYAFLLAILTALVDSLPIFGTGTILIPLAVYRFFVGDTRTAVGFCVLYLAVTIVRQIIEPKLLGAGAGLHPLLMLMALYAGLRLFGILGMILMPIAVILFKNILLSLKKQNEGADHVT